ncbi:hypothetical protein [Lancefieldella sp. Marseille-Q7238]|uniref:hypothetical protein n=1 Tax=Lancefieldella sp. Marseille-Q7238 TaxID=3022127 RepID=UPI0024A9CAB0|nr:hypothetical protein [Lancefieldella sp. Marseille-Q7238]
MKTPKKGISCDKSPKNAMSCEVFLSQLWHFFGIEAECTCFLEMGGAQHSVWVDIAQETRANPQRSLKRASKEPKRKKLAINLKIQVHYMGFSLYLTVYVWH